MKRILLIDRFYFPDEQATSIYLTELTLGLKDKFDFNILCGPPFVATQDESATHAATNRWRPVDALWRESPLPRSRVYQVPSLNLPKRLLICRFLNDLSFLVLALFQGLAIPRPDLVLSQTSPPGVWWVGFLLSRWHRVPWIHIFQDIFPDNLKVLNGSRNGTFFSLLDKVSNFPLLKADRLIVVGEDMKSRLIKKGFPASKIYRTHNWVDLDFIRPLPKKNSFSEKHQLADRFVVLYAGNFGRIHNFEDFLAAADRLKDNSGIRFVLVGDGALKKNLAKQCEAKKLQNVSILPYESRSMLPKILATADVSVVLLKKGMVGLSVPSKIYSMLASGRPVLACVEEESEVARLVRESNSGFVIPPGKADEWVARIQQLIQNPGLKEELGRNARHFVETQNYQKRAFHDYERIFRELTPGRDH